MRIADGLDMLELEAMMENGPGMIYPAVLWDDNEAVLVDTGLPGLWPQITAAIKQAGLPTLRKIIITHSDADHTGSLRAIADEVAAIKVYAHEMETPYIQADREPIRLRQMESSLSMLSGERRQRVKAIYRAFKANYRDLGAAVDHTVSDGETLPWGGGVTVIHTPGHTPGHLSLYHRPSRTLIAGDILQVGDGGLVPAPAFTIVDRGQAAESIKKLTSYDIREVLCYHGGLWSDQVNERIREMAK